MTDLTPIQYGLIALIFVWSGFVRSGLGFGGAVLSLPFLLLVHNEPLVFLPIISVQLMVFATITIVSNNRTAALNASNHEGGTVDWRYLGRILAIMIIPKLIGVLGLISLPNTLMSLIIFGIVSVYAMSYILNRPFRSNSRTLDVVFLVLGGYISGTSLIGAPLIIAVAAQHLERHQLRDTLFALWFILVTIKMAAFIYAGVDLQLIHHLWLLPCAALGHILGLHAHARILKAETPIFYRVLGSVLIAISGIGLWQSLGQYLGG